VFYLDVAYVCNGFQVFSCVFSSVSEACFKCFICLQTYVTTVVFGCFKSKPGVASLLAFCCIVSVCSPSCAGKTSIRRHGWVLPNAAPSPLVARAAQAHVECVKRSAARVHPSERPDASTAFFFLPSHTMNMSIVIEWLNSEKRKTSTRLVYLIELHKFRQSLDSEDVFAGLILEEYFSLDSEGVCPF
jgi:hypothetical protein